MTDDGTTGNNFAVLRNVTALATLIERLKGRTPALPGLACFYGFSGYGKSMAATWCANRFDARLVQMGYSWTARSLCEAILTELGIKPRGSIAKMVEMISERLGITETPLIIDEADFLAKHNMVELVREIYESCEVPIILIGEELLPQTLQRWERVHGRILYSVAAQAATRSDVDQLAKIYLRGVEIDDALKDLILKFSRGSHRRVVTNLDIVREFAITEGVNRVTRAAWAAREFPTGLAPEARTRAA